MKRFKLPVAVYLILIENNQILLQRRYNTSYQDGNYSFVAGHIDGGESLLHAMRREALEEAGIHIEEKDLTIVHVSHRHEDDVEYIDVFLICKKYNGKLQIMEPDKCDELAFYSLDQLPENMVPCIKSALEHYLNNEQFSIWGWE